MAVSLRIPDYLISSVSKNQHIIPTHPAVKLPQIFCSISWPGNGELSQLANSVPPLHLESASGAHPSPRLLDIGVLSTCVRCFRHTLLLMWHGCPLCYLVQHFIQLQQQRKDMVRPKNCGVIRNSSGKTNWPLMDPRADSSSPTPQSNKETPTDVPWPEWKNTKDLRSTDLRQENLSQKHGVNEE